MTAIMTDKIERYFFWRVPGRPVSRGVGQARGLGLLTFNPAFWLMVDSRLGKQRMRESIQSGQPVFHQASGPVADALPISLITSYLSLAKKPGKGNLMGGSDLTLLKSLSSLPHLVFIADRTPSIACLVTLCGAR